MFVMSMVVWVARRSAGDACVTMHQGGAMSLQGACALDLPAMRIESDGTAHLRETPEGIRLLDGTVIFSVVPVPKGHPPVRVWVSGGTIDVLGTRFRVTHSQSGGSVQLLEGTIRFTFASGEVSVMHAGETLSWGTQDEPSSSANAKRAKPTSPARRLGDAQNEYSHSRTGWSSMSTGLRSSRRQPRHARGVQFKGRSRSSLDAGCDASLRSPAA